MNLTSQCIMHPKIKDTVLNNTITMKSTPRTVNRVRFGERIYTKQRFKKWRFYVDNISFDMIYCPRGHFIKKGYVKEVFDMNEASLFRSVIIEDEPILINPFYLGETEVTQELFEKVLNFNPSEFRGDGYPNSNKHPVENIYWYNSLRFCNKLSSIFGFKPYYIFTNGKEHSSIPKINQKSNGFRLPTTEEWKYAAMAGTQNRYYTANQFATFNGRDGNLNSFAWYEGNSNNQTHPVKSKLPNNWGFYDMNGNVSEMTSNIDEDDYDRNASKVDTCGGSFKDKASKLEILKGTAQSYADSQYKNIGFRICMNQKK